MFNCTRDSKEVVGNTNDSNKAIEKKVILVADELELKRERMT